jgi:uncharacterized alkaline shock family protein YloU
MEEKIRKSIVIDGVRVEVECEERAGDDVEVFLAYLEKIITVKKEEIQ